MADVLLGKSRDSWRHADFENTQVQHGMGHFTLFTGHHISLIFIFVNFLRIICT